MLSKTVVDPVVEDLVPRVVLRLVIGRLFRPVQRLSVVRVLVVRILLDLVTRDSPAPLPVEAGLLPLVGEDEGGLGEVRHARLATSPVTEEEGEAEEDEGEGGGGEEEGDCPGREGGAVVQVREVGDVGSSERERLVTDCPGVVERGEEREEPGQATVTVERVPSHLQPRDGGPGQEVRPHLGQAVPGEVHLELVVGPAQQGGQVTELRVVTDGDLLQDLKPLQAPGLNLHQQGTVGYLQ